MADDADNTVMKCPSYLLSYIFATCGVMVSGCGGDDAPAAKPAVMVVDDGFDTSLDVFEGKILAAKTVQCESEDNDQGEGEDLRARYLRFLKQRDESCTLVDGVEAKEDRLGTVEKHRDQWNAMVEADDAPARRFSQNVFETLADSFDEATATRFHGTATAGVVARNNADVKLVLIELPLSSPDELEAFPCIKQEDVDAQLELLRDEEVRRAIIAHPASLLDEQIHELQNQHNVRVVNESFGRLPLQAIEQIQRDNNCPHVELRDVFALEAELSGEWAERNPPANVLVVKSAGNSGTEVNSREEHRDCVMSDQVVTIGSHRRKGARSEFSNFGDCVDLFAPGERVVAPLTGGWLLPLTGTSFSAPLVTRWLSLQTDVPLNDAKQVKQHLLGLRDDDKQLPAELFPHSLTYDPIGSVQALKVAGGDESVSPDDQLLRGRAAIRLTSLQLRSPILAPLFWGARQRATL